MPESDPKQKKDFFISYNHHDQQWAEWIASALETDGYSIVIQAWDFRPGSNFVLKMQSGLESSDRVLAVLSPDALSSPYVQSEWASAFARDPTGEHGILVPVKVRECNPRGLLSQIVWIDLVGQTDLDAQRLLLAGVRKGRAKPGIAPVFPGIKVPNELKAAFPGPKDLAPLRLQSPTTPGYLFVGVPDLPRAFIGRETLLQTVVDLIAGKTINIATQGLGGVGKSTLAAAAAYHPAIQAYFSGILWASLGQQPDLEGTLNSWGDALGVDFRGTRSIGDRQERLKRALAGRRVLIVIDDAWDLESVEALKCGGPESVYLLTTRVADLSYRFADPDGAITVSELDADSALRLLMMLAPEACSADEDAARALVRAVGALPLAVEMLGAYLSAAENRYFEEDQKAAFARLAEPSERLRQACVRLGTGGDTRTSLREAVLLSLEGLPEEAAAAFAALSAFAPKPESFDREAALAVTGASTGSLARLIDRHLLERSGTMLAIHQMVAETARELPASDAGARHAQHYLQRAQAAASEWQVMEAIYPQVKWAFRYIVEPSSVLDFAAAVGDYQGTRGLRQDHLWWNERELSAARQQGDEHRQASCLNTRGWIYDSLGEREKALAYYEQALSIQRAVGDRRGEAVTLSNMGSVYDSLGEREKALSYFEQALPIQRAVGDRQGEAATLNNIGGVYNSLGERNKALSYFEQALQIQRAVGHRQGEAATLNNIGGVSDSMGEREKALSYYQQALPIVRAVGDRRGEAVTLNNIGSIYNSLGELETALSYFEQALPIQREVGDRAAEAVTRFNVAIIYHANGRLEQAVAELRIVVELDAAVQHPDLESDRAILAEVEAELAALRGKGSSEG